MKITTEQLNNLLKPFAIRDAVNEADDCLDYAEALLRDCEAEIRKAMLILKAAPASEETTQLLADCETILGRITDAFLID